MRDQAEQLRQIVSTLQLNRKVDNTGYIDSARVITITSGKGGVGKTSFTINLAISLAKMGYRIVIIDGDFGLANVDLMLGISSRYGLREIITGQMSLEEVMTEGPYGIKFISGGSGIKELVNLSPKELEAFLGINKAETVYEAQEILDKFIRAADKFLKVKINSMGYILEDSHVPKSIKEQVPYVLRYPRCQASRQVRIVARRLLNEDREYIGYNGGMTSYIRKFLSLFKAN